jgi:hypothetical protein
MTERASFTPHRGSKIDLARSLRFTFDDPEWVPKILLGAFFTLLSVVLVGAVFVIGYFLETLRRTARGEPRPLPGWTDLRGLLTDGLGGLAICIAHLLPLFPLVFLMALAWGGVAAILETAQQTPSEIQTAFMLYVITGYAFCTLLVLGLLLYLPVPLTRFALSKQVGAAFQFRENVDFIRRNQLGYVQALSISMIAGFIAQFGVFVLCVGFFPAAFWSICVSGYAMGELAKGDEELVTEELPQ